MCRRLIGSEKREARRRVSVRFGGLAFWPQGEGVLWLALIILVGSVASFRWGAEWPLPGGSAAAIWDGHSGWVQGAVVLRGKGSVGLSGWGACACWGCFSSKRR